MVVAADRAEPVEHRVAVPGEQVGVAAAAGLDVVHRHAGLGARRMRRTLDALPRADLDRVVALLADPKRRPLLVGGRSSRLLAAYLRLHLVQLREGAVLLPEDAVVRAATLAGAGARDVLVTSTTVPPRKRSTRARCGS